MQRVEGVAVRRVVELEDADCSGDAAGGGDGLQDAVHPLARGGTAGGAGAGEHAVGKRALHVAQHEADRHQQRVPVEVVKPERQTNRRTDGQSARASHVSDSARHAVAALVTGRRDAG